ncbi:hypothetical protein ASD65_08960 [Microbacterium sp. Root61]|uniref:DUF4862 family protein n=1 Tax=Microbacterium sp. Root61 TaxID=1736570 RepID=UPI0007008342|nr:DUF4862 family protein [Microbacterium sp. Root61]KRA24533.1 hypothetical protein ASD65_08960 [Microbacterium sp. Root61]
MTAASAPRFEGLVVGAYAASPAHRQWDPSAESAFFEALAATPGIGALELPWLGSIHPHDDGWLHRSLPATLRAVVTDIPYTMGRIGAAPAYGLASHDEDGRRAAIADVRLLLDDVRAFDDAQSRSVVGVVELHSAPRGARGGVDPLVRSLTEIAGWEWGSVDLVLEHCDAWRDGQAPEKGFLDLSVELDAIERSGTPIGISLNWGRSAIEGHSADTPVAHAREAAERGLLRGFIASGAAATETAFGPAWIDAHLPFAPSPTIAHGTPGSLMTETAVADVVRAAGRLDWAGVKVGCAQDAASVADRVVLVAEAVGVLNGILDGP